MKCQKCKAKKDMFLTNAFIKKELVEMLVCSSCGASIVLKKKMNPNYQMTFYKDNKLIGTLDFNGPQMTFEGEAEESAKIFFDQVAKCFEDRLKEEREKYVRS
jgi:protein-arginine kinase activator protein McsA